MSDTLADAIAKRHREQAGEPPAQATPDDDKAGGEIVAPAPYGVLAAALADRYRTDKKEQPE